MNQVVISGIGVICNHGTGWKEVRESVKKGLSRFEYIPEEVAAQASKNFMIGRITEYDREKHFKKKQLRLVDKFLTMSVYAAGLALEDAGLENMSSEDREDTGTLIGTSRPEFAGFQRFSTNVFKRLPKKINPMFFPLLARNAAGGQIAITFSLKGYSSTISINNLSGIHTISRGFDLIKRGRSELVLTGGIESLSKLSLAHSVYLYKDRLEYKDSEFFGEDPARIVPSEAACILLLEEKNRALGRGVNPYGEINGYKYGKSETSDEMAGEINAFISSLGKKWQDFDHLSSSQSGGGLPNDVMEKNALAIMMKSTGFCPQITAPNALFGETEAAGSALLAAVSANAVRHNEVFPSPGMKKDSELLRFMTDTKLINQSMISATDMFGNYGLLSISKVES